MHVFSITAEVQNIFGAMASTVLIRQTMAQKLKDINVGLLKHRSMLQTKQDPTDCLLTVCLVLVTRTKQEFTDCNI